MTALRVLSPVAMRLVQQDFGQSHFSHPHALAANTWSRPACPPLLSSNMLLVWLCVPMMLHLLLALQQAPFVAVMCNPSSVTLSTAMLLDSA